jgi:hypothetical protein
VAEGRDRYLEVNCGRGQRPISGGELWQRAETDKGCRAVIEEEE